MEKLSKIYWIEACFSSKYGGAAYSDRVKKVLAGNFDLEIIQIKENYLKNRYLKLIEWFFRALFLKKKDGLAIIDNSCSVIPVNLFKKGKRSIGLVHHIDSSQSRFRFLFSILDGIFLKNLKKADTIVVVSEYWRDYFLKKSHKDVIKIYNSVEISGINPEETQEFKKRFGLLEKPIVYIGNCQKAKGVVQTYKELRDLDVYLITSGKKQVDVGALNLDLEYRDYLKLLSSCEMAIVMSKFKEGWCRTAAEAMLLKKPVIGSGLGGQKELLEKGGQIICSFESLREKVEYLLDNSEIRKEIGEKGHNFAKGFTFDKFKKKWLDLIWAKQ